MHTFIAGPLIAQPHLNGGGRGDTVGFKLEEGKGLREGCNSKELWKSFCRSGRFEKSQKPHTPTPRMGHPALERSLRSSLEISARNS